MVPILTLIKLNTPVSWQRPFVGRVISSCCKPMVEPPYVVFILTILNKNKTFFSRLAVWSWSLTRTSITVMYFLKEFILQSLESFQQRSQELLSGQPYSKEEKFELWPCDLKNKRCHYFLEAFQRKCRKIFNGHRFFKDQQFDLDLWPENQLLLCRNIHSLAIFKQEVKRYWADITCSTDRPTNGYKKISPLFTNASLKSARQG